MVRSFKGLMGSALFGVVLATSGCSSSSLEEGVPKNTGYVAPKMVPNMAKTASGKPLMGATEKDKQEQATKAKAAEGAAGAPSP